MYCPQCGTQNDDNAFRCIQCGEIIQPVPIQLQPKVIDDTPSMRMILPVGRSFLAIAAGYAGLFSHSKHGCYFPPSQLCLSSLEYLVSGAYGIMYCRKCGTQNDDNAFKCIKCGDILQPIQRDGGSFPSIPNYLVQSILVTLFCCVPFGIVCIVYAAQVNTKLAAGDYTGAVETSKKARTWCWISFGTGLGWFVIWLLFVVFGRVLSEM